MKTGGRRLWRQSSVSTVHRNLFFPRTPAGDRSVLFQVLEQEPDPKSRILLDCDEMQIYVCVSLRRLGLSNICMGNPACDLYQEVDLGFSPGYI